MKKHPVLSFILLFAGIITVSIALMLIIVNLSTGKTTFQSKNIAIVKIEGPILESLDVLKELKEISLDKQIKAVVLRINSPGGAVSPSQEIYSQILKLKKDKKVVVSMGSLAASGGYYIACAADRIMANPGSTTGSIGVIIEFFGLQELIKKISVEPRIIKTGSHKGMGSPFKELTDRDRKYLQGITDNVYQQFIEAVSINRGIPLEKMTAVAEGKLFTGEQAQKIGLVDELGNIYDAIDLAKKLAGLPEDAGVKWPEEPSPFERFMSGDDAKSLVHTVLRKIGMSSLPLFMVNEEHLPVYR